MVLKSSTEAMDQTTSMTSMTTTFLVISPTAVLVVV
jgi:hypothetical protein